MSEQPPVVEMQEALWTEMERGSASTSKRSYRRQVQVDDEDTNMVVFPQDLDMFFTRIYFYYYGRGFVNILVQRLSSLCMLTFTVVFAAFLVVGIDWHLLMTCTDDSTCHHVGFYTRNPFSAGDKAASIWNSVLVILPACGFLFYFLWSLVATVNMVVATWRMRCFFKDRLKIDDRALQTVQWQEVVQAVQRVDRRSRRDLPISLAQEMAMRIMRRDNYLIALLGGMAGNALDLSVRVPWVGKVAMPVCGSLVWNLHVTLMNWMFTDTHQLRSLFLQDFRGLQRRFFQFGIFNLVCLPFVLPFLLVFFAFQHAEEFQAKKSYLGPRTWSPRAAWVFRDFNELPHFLERRMSGALEHAYAYQRQFPSSLSNTVARCLSFFCGSVVTVLVVVAVFNENILVSVTVGDKNLLWVTALLSGGLAVARALSTDLKDQVAGPVLCMRKVMSFTRWVPPASAGKYHLMEVRDAFLTMFCFRIQLFLQVGEILPPICRLLSLG